MDNKHLIFKKITKLNSNIQIQYKKKTKILKLKKQRQGEFQCIINCKGFVHKKWCKNEDLYFICN